MYFQAFSADEKLQDITNAVLDELITSCIECGITNNIVNMQSFSCISKSPTYVTYRARLEGTSETDSGSLISLIEKWVSGEASIIVTGVLMTVDSECSVAISSLSEEECLTNDPTTNPTTYSTTDSEMTMNTDITTDSTATTSDSTAAIIGGVVAIILVVYELNC